MAKFSSKPGKQRKLVYTAPAHIRHKLLAAPISPELQTKYPLQSLPVKKGDTVRILRGNYVGVEGKITRVDPRGHRVYIEGVTSEKTDGTTVQVPINPSKITLTKLNLDDKWRKKAIERKAAAISPPTVTAEPKPSSQPTQTKEA